MGSDFEGLDTAGEGEFRAHRILAERCNQPEEGIRSP